MLGTKSGSEHRRPVVDSITWTLEGHKGQNLREVSVEGTKILSMIHMARFTMRMRNDSFMNPDTGLVRCRSLSKSKAQVDAQS